MKKIMRFIVGEKKVERKLSKIIKQINAAEKILNPHPGNFKKLTLEFKKRFSDGEPLDSILPDAFAVCRSASEHVMKMRHFDVQLMGGISLHKGSIAEMKTGEGKTLVATLPAYLNSLTGRQVHIVTVNDYLAKRDADIMRPLYESLGLTVKSLQSNMEHHEKADTYSADVLYATSSNLGFDYLRDNMANHIGEILQTDLYYAIIDEVDSILVDDARTPLIISGATELNVAIPTIMNNLSSEFTTYWWNNKADNDSTIIEEDVVLNEKDKTAILNDSGYKKLERLLVENGVLKEGMDLYDVSMLYLVNACQTALKATHIYKNSVDYLVVEGKVKIINQSTGRIEEGRRWSDGLHQSIEVKERVEINADNETLGTVSLQNFFRMYDKLSGMSGTAKAEAEEFRNVYGMGVVSVPTNKPLLRTDKRDEIFLDEKSKIAAIISNIIEMRELKRPVLVGTSSVEESDMISEKLLKKGIRHQILNAKHHLKEAKIISEAGQPGSVTIATNMAGRGTDILLGGSLGDRLKALENPTQEDIKVVKAHWKSSHNKVLKAGGLHVIGTSRNESRRVDDQLIGRAGRQGDPGSSKFFVSLEDKIMRVFGPKTKSILKNVGFEEGEGVSISFLDKAIRNSQSKIEAQGYNMRKDLLKYDDITNMQRIQVYSMRHELLTANDPWSVLQIYVNRSLDEVIDSYIPFNGMIELWDTIGLELFFEKNLKLKIEITKFINSHEGKEDELHDFVRKEISKVIQLWERKITNSDFEKFSREIMLYTIDKNWREQITELDQLREGIHLRGYAQKDPVQEYGKDALRMFKDMIHNIKGEFLENTFKALTAVIEEKEVNEKKLLESSINIIK